MTERPVLAGIGATAFSRQSGRSELRLAIEAILVALADCGLSPSAVDGMVTMTLDNNDEIEVAKSLGCELTFFARTPYGGGGAAACVMLAAMAVKQGLASTVVCYRALNARSGDRYGQPADVLSSPAAREVRRSWTIPFGVVAPATSHAILAQRYLHDFGRTTDDLAAVSVLARRHAATNPAAIFHGRPITVDDHHRSRWIASPLRLLDCCVEADGAVAIVVTSEAIAAGLRERPVYLLAAAQGAGRAQELINNYYGSSLTDWQDIGIVGRLLWERSGLRPDDVDVVSVYDHFTSAVLMSVEALGFCGPGDAPDLFATGRFALEGASPLNPNGGQLGEGYIHGFNGIAESVRQLRGTAVNQVRGARVVLVTSGTAVPSSGMLLSTDRPAA